MKVTLVIVTSLLSIGCGPKTSQIESGVFKQYTDFFVTKLTDDAYMKELLGRDEIGKAADPKHATAGHITKEFISKHDSSLKNMMRDWRALGLSEFTVKFDPALEEYFTNMASGAAKDHYEKLGSPENQGTSRKELLGYMKAGIDIALPLNGN